MKARLRAAGLLWVRALGAVLKDHEGAQRDAELFLKVAEWAIVLGAFGLAFKKTHLPILRWAQLAGYLQVYIWLAATFQIRWPQKSVVNPDDAAEVNAALRYNLLLTLLTLVPVLLLAWFCEATTNALIRAG